ncbi:MAG: hypothetical protein KAG61_04710 [Bacteriovoracaceae bacterium]|nr:hypothetical protein [Bacteriovoracaceae bacterium]
MKYVLLGAIFILSSCSSVRFYSEGEGNIAISEKNFIQESPILSVESKEFFLWGNVPVSQVVDLSVAVVDKGHFQNTNVSIEVYRTFGDILRAVFTLGMYSPVHYNISIIGKQYEDNSHL